MHSLLPCLVEPEHGVPVLVRGIVQHLSVRPYEAVADLVADLHDRRSSAAVLQGSEDALCVVVERILENLSGRILPCGGLDLMVRVSPGVAVVDVEGEVHPRGLYALCERESVAKVAESFLGRVSAGNFRIHESPQAYGVEVMVRQNLADILLHAVLVLVDGPERLALRDERNVGADTIILGLGAARQSECCRQPKNR